MEPEEPQTVIVSKKFWDLSKKISRWMEMQFSMPGMQEWLDEIRAVSRFHDAEKVCGERGNDGEK